MHTGVPAQKLQTSTVMMVLVSQIPLQDHGNASPKHLRKMVEGVCVIKTTIHENLPTTFQYFQFVTWKFLSLSATALIGLSLTGVPWAAPQ
jgi:hypothetical protein